MKLAPICKLPLEVFVHVLEFLGPEDASKTIKVCEYFQNAVCSFVQSALSKLQMRVQNQVCVCISKIDNIPLNEEHLRVDFVKLLSFFRFLLTEIDIIFALVWRYKNFVSVWSILCPVLAPVIEEFNKNIDIQINLKARNLDFDTYNLHNLFPQWRNFLLTYDNELSEKLSLLVPNTMDFELMVIDILTCCPSINFQIAFKRLVGGDNVFNTYSFFKLNHLKPACQIPDVHNSELSIKNKQIKLIKFLRECIQWENIAHLQEFLREILNLEMTLWGFSLEGNVRDELIQSLKDKYDRIQTHPFVPIEKSTNLSYDETGTYWSEYYTRLNSYNEGFTGLRCIVDVLDQRTENLPLIFQTFRGWYKKPLHEVIEAVDNKINFDNIGSHFKIIPYEGSNFHKKPKFQLIIQYRERLFSTPAEAVVNLSYDENKNKHITTDFIESEPFPFDAILL